MPQSYFCQKSGDIPSSQIVPNINNIHDGGIGMYPVNSTRKYLMSLNHVSFVLLLLLLISAGVCATESPMKNSAGSPLSGVDSVNGSGTIGDSPVVNDILRNAPINPAFLRYQENINDVKTAETGMEHGLGEIPSPLYRPELADATMNELSGQDFNRTFDLRENGKVSAVRDQDGFGTCWAFSTFGSLESYLLPGENRTFSPKNMVNRAGFDLSYNSGGSFDVSTAYLTRWDGPVDEATDPYPIKNWTDSAAYPPVFHVQNVITYPPRSNQSGTEFIKAGLQRWGAAAVGFYWSDVYYNKTSFSYYQPATAPNLRSGGGHGVTLVGWNDTFPASAFNETPPGDGAWILKNSWGSAWGDHGFFYVSYYDKYLGSVLGPEREYRSTAFFTAEPVDNYDLVYLHDPLGECRDYYVGEPKNGTVASRFNANESGILSAIGFYTTDVNTRYKAIIYRNASDGPIGDEAARFEGNLTWMGYHTVLLPQGSEVRIQKGENFSVVLSLENEVYGYPVAFEEPIRGYSSKATAKPGESYYAVNENGPFYDLTLYNPNASTCVRAYTGSVPTPTPTPTPAILSASFSAEPVKGPSPLTVRFTDTSTGTPTSWVWDFGTGSQSVLQNPEKTYTKPGLYSVSLIVRKEQQVDRISKYQFITVQNSSEPVS